MSTTPILTFSRRHSHRHWKPGPAQRTGTGQHEAIRYVWRSSAFRLWFFQTNDPPSSILFSHESPYSTFAPLLATLSPTYPPIYPRHYSSIHAKDGCTSTGDPHKNAQDEVHQRLPSWFRKQLCPSRYPQPRRDVQRLQRPVLPLPHQHVPTL